jgi:hypothetical protein
MANKEHLEVGMDNVTTGDRELPEQGTEQRLDTLDNV